jgi:hypothetical protein
MFTPISRWVPQLDMLSMLTYSLGAVAGPTLRRLLLFTLLIKNYPTYKFTYVPAHCILFCVIKLTEFFFIIIMVIINSSNNIIKVVNFTTFNKIKTCRLIRDLE